MDWDSLYRSGTSESHMYERAVVKWPLLVHCMMRKLREQFFSVYFRQINYDFPQQRVSKLMTRLNKRQIFHPLPISLGKGSQKDLSWEPLSPDWMGKCDLSGHGPSADYPVSRQGQGTIVDCGRLSGRVGKYPWSVGGDGWSVFCLVLWGCTLVSLCLVLWAPCTELLWAGQQT